MFFVLSCSYWFSVAFLKVCHQDLLHEAYNLKPISLKIQKHDPHQESFKHPWLSHPKRDNLPLRHTAHPTTPWSPTPHRDAFLHHLWGEVAQYSVWEIGPDKRKWGIRGEGGRTLLTYPGYSRPVHFLSRVAGSGDIVHRPDYTPNHQRSQLGTLPRRIVGVSMTNGTRHDPCIPRHWAMICPAWTLTRTSHNRVVNKIRPNTDVASISSVLHLVWPLAQSLSSMVVTTRSQNSSWHSHWDRDTQAPQLRQSNNTLRGWSQEGLWVDMYADLVAHVILNYPFSKGRQLVSFLFEITSLCQNTIKIKQQMHQNLLFTVKVIKTDQIAVCHVGWNFCLYIHKFIRKQFVLIYQISWLGVQH